MLHCFTSSFRQSSSYAAGNHCSASQENSAVNTPRSNALSSPSVNLRLEFDKVIQSPSYINVWNKIEVVENWENLDFNQFLTGVLHPNHEHVHEILQHASSNPIIKNLSTYFNDTEQICHQLLFWERGIHHTRSLYVQIKKLIDVLPGDLVSLDQEQCNLAYGIFLQFENMEDPFPCLGSYDFIDMHHHFSDLKEQVDGRLQKPQSRLCAARCATTCPATCYIGTALRFAITSVSVAAHALAALAAGSSFPPAPKLVQKDLAHIALQDPVAMCDYVLRSNLQTTDLLANQLQTAVEGDKSFIRVGIAQGGASYPTSLVMKRLAKSHPNILLLLGELKVHICNCFNSINSARSQLLQKIQVHQRL